MVKLAAFIHKKAEHASVFFKFMVLIETVMFIATGIVAILVSYMFTGIIREKEIVLGNTNLERVAAYMREKYERVESLANSMNDNYISNIMTDIYENPQNVYDYENISHVNVFFSEKSDRYLYYEHTSGYFAGKSIDRRYTDERYDYIK